MSLHLDWITRADALTAAKRWHYSRTLSSSKNVYLGAWEDDRFIGAVVYGIGAGRATDGSAYGLRRAGDVAELTRVALADDHQAPVSRIVSIATRMLTKQSPGLKLIISFADPKRGHHGGIYQAMNWLYMGTTSGEREYWLDGRWVHTRTATSRGSLRGLPQRPIPPKHRYLYPLTPQLRARLEPLAKPYPRPIAPASSGRMSDASEARLSSPPDDATVERRSRRSNSSSPDLEP